MYCKQKGPGDAEENKKIDIQRGKCIAQHIYTKTKRKQNWEKSILFRKPKKWQK